MTRAQLLASPLAFIATLLLLSCATSIALQDESDSPSTKLSLVASNPFRMIIRPTLFELDFVALSIVEEAMATAILQSTDSALVDVNINVNQMNWLSSASDEIIDGTVNALGVEGIPTTVLKFFAVGTFLWKVPAGSTSYNPGSLAAVKALDDIVQKAFSIDNYSIFIELMRNSGEPLLEGVQDAVAIRTNENPTVPTTPNNVLDDNDGDRAFPLGTVDFIIMCICIMIFMGIAFMVCQNQRDRGYIENQRLQNLNAYGRRNNETSSTYAHRNDDDEDDEESKPERTSSGIESIKSCSESSKSSAVNNLQSHEEQPSHTSSSLFTSTGDDPHSFVTNFNFPPSTLDINTHLNSRKKRYTSKVMISIESIHNCDSRSLPTPSSRKGMTASSSSVQSSDEKSECKSTGALSLGGFSSPLSSDFGPINWFRKPGVKGLPVKSSHDANSNIDEQQPVEEIDSTSSSKSSSSEGGLSSDSEDVFRVGNIKTNVLATGSVANDGDAVSKASSVVSEWMKTIRVVSSHDSHAESEVTCKGSASEQSSTAANSSTEAPSLVDEDDEIESLEHSMANSKGMVSTGMIGFEEESAGMVSTGISGFEEESSTMEF